MINFNFRNTPIIKNSTVDSTIKSRKNTRTSVRYVRKDITASIYEISLFSCNKIIVVELLDISSKGILIATEKKLSINQMVAVILTFDNQYVVFKRVAKVIHKTGAVKYKYGLKFNRISHGLGDYLLNTQKKLVFK